MEAMDKKQTNEPNVFSRNIVELKLIADRMAEGKIDEPGIFSNMHQILYVVNRKESVSPKEIISELNIAKSNLAILAKKMIEDGLIESHKDADNKREIFYTITEKGKTALKEKLDRIDDEYEEGTKAALNAVCRAVEELKKLENKKNTLRKKRENKH